MACKVVCMSHFLNISLALLLLSTLSYVSVYAQDDEEIPKIAIVGGGIAGASTAHYLRQLFGEKLEMDVFEADSVGGRLAVINIGGQEYEAGGSIIHPRNQYMLHFVEKLGLEKMVPGSALPSTLGLFSSQKGMYFQTSSWSPVTWAKLFWRYGWDIKRIQEWVANMLDSFSKIYTYQKSGMAFTSVEDLLRSMDERFVNFTRHSFRTVLSDAGFSETFIDELVTGALRDNYGQTPKVHGFVGAVCMAGVDQGLWAVKGGNKNVAQRLLKDAQVNLIQAAVTDLFQVKNEGGAISYEIQYEKAGAKATDEDKTSSREYDLVIVATPLKSGSNFNINFKDFPDQFKVPDIPFHSLETMFVHGRPNLTQFGVESPSDLPTHIMTTDSEVFFNAIGKQLPTGKKDNSAEQAESQKDYAVWKVFLNKVPSESQIDSLFESHKDLRLVKWLAYPDYSPNMDLPSFVLHDRLYYVNSVETAASAMEMEVIGARNVALLAFNQWYGHFDKIDEFVIPSRDGESGRKPDEL